MKLDNTDGTNIAVASSLKTSVTAVGENSGGELAVSIASETSACPNRPGDSYIEQPPG